MNPGMSPRFHAATCSSSTFLIACAPACEFAGTAPCAPANPTVNATAQIPHMILIHIHERIVLLPSVYRGKPLRLAPSHPSTPPTSRYLIVTEALPRALTGRRSISQVRAGSIRTVL